MNLIFAGFLFIAYYYSSASKDTIRLNCCRSSFYWIVSGFCTLTRGLKIRNRNDCSFIYRFNLKDASKFAFLLSIPTILGALVFLLIEISTSSYSFNFISLFIGLITSCIVAFLTIKYFLIFVDRIGMYPFVIYRIILGCILLLII